MPDELFFNSKVNVVTCIMIFTAHKAHPKNKETYFGYYKDDGFVKRKNKGRIDALERWEPTKEKWLSDFYNRKTIAGLSINKAVSAGMEWLAESYMDTDYSNLADELFEDAALSYMSFLMNNRLLDKITESGDE